MNTKPIFVPKVALGLRDLVIIKSFIEKGFRENLFNQQEIQVVEQVYEKLVIILEDAKEFHKQLSES